MHEPEEQSTVNHMSSSNENNLKNDNETTPATGVVGCLRDPGNDEAPARAVTPRSNDDSDDDAPIVEQSNPTRSSITTFRGAVAAVRATKLTMRQRPRDVFKARSGYPCYVISITNLLKLDKFCQHEEALERGLLEVLSADSPEREQCFFVSQNWESADGPDNARGTKLRWLKKLKEHYQMDEELYIWIDILSVPQRDRNLQVLALESLCCYSQLCSRFIPLVRDVSAWQRLYGEDIRGKAGCLGTYFSRGWCRIEMAAALAPQRLNGHWRSPREVRFRYHHDPDAADDDHGELLKARNLRNPLAGCFSSEDDRLSLAPMMVAAVALRYRQHADDERPLWLRILDGPDFFPSSEQQQKKRKLNDTTVVTDSEESSYTASLAAVAAA